MREDVPEQQSQKSSSHEGREDQPPPAIDSLRQVGVEPGDRLEVLHDVHHEVSNVTIDPEFGGGGSVTLRSELGHDFPALSFDQIKELRGVFTARQRFHDRQSSPEKRYKKDGETVSQVWRRLDLLDLRPGDVLTTVQGDRLTLAGLSFGDRSHSSGTAYLDHLGSANPNDLRAISLKKLVDLPRWLVSIDRRPRPQRSYDHSAAGSHAISTDRPEPAKRPLTPAEAASLLHRFAWSDEDIGILLRRGSRTIARYVGGR